MGKDLDGKCAAKALQALRFACNMSQEALEAKCGMRHQQISRLESGSVIPKINSVRKLVWAMGYEFRQFAELYEQYLHAELENRQMPIPMVASRDKVEYNIENEKQP